MKKVSEAILCQQLHINEEFKKMSVFIDIQLSTYEVKSPP